MTVRRIPPDEVPHDRAAIEGDGFTATFASFDASARRDTWHHHGDHDIVAYLLTGSIDIETPDDGVTVMRPGDLVHIERRTIHREVYEGHIEMLGFDVGTGPGRVEADREGHLVMGGRTRDARIRRRMHCQPARRCASH